MQIAIDCASPDRLARFWAQVLPGYQLQPPPEGFATWQALLEHLGVPPEHWDDRSALVGDGPRLFFAKVPEPKTVKNRVHLDLHAGGGPGVPLEEQRVRVRAEVARLQGLGAAFVSEHEEMGVVWAVLTDIEGNEFCA